MLSPPQRPAILSTGISRLAVNAVVVTTVLSFLAISLSGVRFYVRGRAGLGQDDYVLMVVVLFLILQLIGQYLLAFLGGEGWGIQDLALHPERITWLLKMIYWPELGYTIVVVLIKTSILFSYLRIFGHVRTTKFYIYTLLALSWGWGIGVFLVGVFQCTPIKKAWQPELPGHCIKTIPFLWGNSISNFIIDWLILAVPVFPVLKLQLPRTQKILVGASFLCGALACIASTIRAAGTASFDFNDIGITDYHASIWVFAEPPLATISCCLPFLARIFSKKVVKGIRNMTTRGTNKDVSQPSNSTGTNGSRYRTLNGEEKHTSTDGSEGLLPAGISKSNIHKVVTTTVNSQNADDDEYELGLYPPTISSAAVQTLPKSQRASEIV